MLKKPIFCGVFELSKLQTANALCCGGQSVSTHSTDGRGPIWQEKLFCDWDGHGGGRWLQRRREPRQFPVACPRRNARRRASQMARDCVPCPTTAAALPFQFLDGWQTNPFGIRVATNLAHISAPQHSRQRAQAFKFLFITQHQLAIAGKRMAFQHGLHPVPRGFHSHPRRCDPAQILPA